MNSKIKYTINCNSISNTKGIGIPPPLSCNSTKPSDKHVYPSLKRKKKAGNQKVDRRQLQLPRFF